MDLPRGITNNAVYIGPEGGFTEEERKCKKREPYQLAWDLES